MNKNFEIDFSNNFFLVKTTATSPMFAHFYIDENNNLRHKSICVRNYISEEDYLEHLVKFNLTRNQYLVEYHYEDPNSSYIRKAIVVHSMREKCVEFDPIAFKAKIRDEKINSIFEDD